MMDLLVLSCLTAFAACSTQQQPYTAPAPTHQVDGGNIPDPLAAQAILEAEHAIKTGRLFLYDAGTIAIYTPGISDAQCDVTRGLPHELLPSGCTEREAPRNVRYAAAFNQKILQHLTSQRRLAPSPYRR